MDHGFHLAEAIGVEERMQAVSKAVFIQTKRTSMNMEEKEEKERPGCAFLC